MDILEFQQLASRTFKDLGSLLSNSIHMTTGMTSELICEFEQACIKDDVVNMGEELGDAEWFVTQYAKMYGISLEHWEFKEVDHSQMTIALGNLLTYDKAELAYGRTGVATHDRAENLFKVLNGIETSAAFYNVDMSEARAKVINKLKIRFPDKFSNELANNRDTAAERIALEQ